MLVINALETRCTIFEKAKRRGPAIYVNDEVFAEYGSEEEAKKVFASLVEAYLDEPRLRSHTRFIFPEGVHDKELDRLAEDLRRA